MEAERIDALINERMYTISCTCLYLSVRRVVVLVGDFLHVSAFHSGRSPAERECAQHRSIEDGVFYDREESMSCIGVMEFFSLRGPPVFRRVAAG